MVICWSLESGVWSLESGVWSLDLGAGAGIVSQMNFKGIASRVCGIDPDERVLSNPIRM